MEEIDDQGVEKNRSDYKNYTDEGPDIMGITISDALAHLGVNKGGHAGAKKEGVE